MTDKKGFALVTTVLITGIVLGVSLVTYGIARQILKSDAVQTIETPAMTTLVAPTPANLNAKPTKSIKHLDLTTQNVVRIYGPIESEAAKTAQDILKLGQTTGKPVYVLINSPGGSVLDGALIVSAIEASTVPVYTICEQMCASMAQIIHAYGTKRMMVDRSVLMAHPASGGVQGTLEQMNSRLSMIMRYVYKFDAYIAKRAGLSFEQYQPMTLVEKWVDAEDATALHFNDEIVSVMIDTPDSLFQIMNEKNKAYKERVNIQWQ